MFSIFLIQATQFRNEEILNLFVLWNIDKGDFVSCFQQNRLQNIKFKILSTENVPNSKTSNENPLKKKIELKLSNEKLKWCHFHLL